MSLMCIDLYETDGLLLFRSKSIIFQTIDLERVIEKAENIFNFYLDFNWEFRFVGVKLLIFRDMLKLEVAPVVLSAGPPTPLPLRRRLRPSRRQAAAKVSRLHRLCHLGRPDFVLPAQTPETVPPPRLSPPGSQVNLPARLSYAFLTNFAASGWRSK